MLSNETISPLQTLNLRVNSLQLTFECDHNFRAIGGEDVSFVEVVGGDAHIVSRVFRSSSVDHTDHPVIDPSSHL